MKKFLQEGLHTYAPALVALSEFRRQIRSRLQTVLNDSIPFSKLGLSVADLRPSGPKLDDSDLGENSSWLGLKKNHGAELYTGCEVQWDLEEPKDKQVWVGVWIYMGRIRTDRDRLFGALQKQRSPLSKTDLEQLPDGSSYLSSYCDSDLFYSFDETFRSLIEEWSGLLSGIGGIQPFLTAASAQLIQPDTD